MSSQTPAADSQAAAPRKRRLFLKLGVAFMALVVLFVVFLPYLIPSSWVTSIAEQSLMAGFKRPVKLGDVSWGWLSGVTVRDVTVSESSEYGGGDFLKVGSISLKVSLSRLVFSLGKNITVTSVVVESPHVVVVRSADGSFNFESIVARKRYNVPKVVAASMTPATINAALRVDVNHVRIDDGSVVLRDLATGAEVAAENLDAVIHADFTQPRVAGSADVSFDLTDNGRAGHVDFAAADFAVDRQPSADAVKTLSASGTVKIEGIEIRELLAAAAPEIGADFASGKTSMDVSYRIDGGRITLSTSNGRVLGLVLGKSAVSSGPVTVGDVTLGFDVSADMEKPVDTLVLKAFNVKTSFADLALASPVTPGAQASALKLKATGSVEPGRIPAGLAALPEGLAISGRAPFEVAVEGVPLPTHLAASVDAGPLTLSGGGLSKKGGTAAKVTVAARMDRSASLTVESFQFALAGGAVSGSGSLDTSGRGASWKALVDLENVNVADYVEASEPVMLAGRIVNSGAMSTGGQDTGGLVVDADFQDFSADLPSRPGRELAVNGKLAVNSVRASASGLTVTLGSSPVTIDAEITSPVTAPTGKVTARAETLNVDDLSAVVGALASVFESPTARPAVGTPATAKDAAPEPSIADRYLRSAGIAFDIRADEVVYGDYKGSNLAVAATLSNGRLIAKDAGLDIFSGSVRLDADAMLAAEAMPAEINVRLAGLQASEPSKRFLSKLVEGLDFSGVFSLDMKAAGDLAGDFDSIAKSFTGDGAFEVTDGVISLASLPAGLDVAFPGLDLTHGLFSRLDGSLALSNGALSSKSVLPQKNYKVFFDARASYTGDYTQDIGVIPEVTGTKIRLLSVTNGRIQPQVTAEDLLKAGLTGALQQLAPRKGDDDNSQGEAPSQPSSQKPSSSGSDLERALDELTGLLKSGKDKKPAETPSK